MQSDPSMRGESRLADSNDAVAEEVDFPTRCTGVVSGAWAVQVATFLPSGEEPVNYHATVLGGSIAIENIDAFNGGRQRYLFVRAISLGDSKVVVIQAGKNGRIETSAMGFTIVEGHSSPQLGVFGKGKFRNLKGYSRPK
jgi:hypothetical protein